MRSRSGNDFLSSRSISPSRFGQYTLTYDNLQSRRPIVRVPPSKSAAPVNLRQRRITIAFDGERNNTCMDSRTMERLMHPPIQYLLRGFLLTVPVKKLPTFSTLLLVNNYKNNDMGININK